MAGDINNAKHICSKYCMSGFCVTVTKTEFIYTGGRERGFIVGILNYPRFPSTPCALLKKAEALAFILIKELYQHSALIETPLETIWISSRPNDLSRVGK